MSKIYHEKNPEEIKNKSVEMVDYLKKVRFPENPGFLKIRRIGPEHK